jgi:single-stranded DNA-specific DHH superfamily exonuclease
MNRFDVFNGDADGICALHQLRLAEPAPSILITGTKREIDLLRRVPVTGEARITVLDISFDVNRESAQALLAAGARLIWFDHHFAGELPDHPGLEAHLDPSPKVCTSLLVDRHLGGAHRAWAVTAAYGDNLAEPAREAAAPLGLSPSALAELQELGELINYNAYGDSLADLCVRPDALYRAIQPHADPLEFARRAPESAKLREGFAADLAQAEGREPLLDEPARRVFRFPNEPWARRVMGIYANRLASASPERATALIMDNPDGTLRISVRAPLRHPHGADALCHAFPTGGGRAAAAGINALPPAELARFLAKFRDAFPPA